MSTTGSRGAAPDPPYAVLDIDGVVADVRHRLHLLEGPRKDWTAFFAAAPCDPVLDEGLAVAQRLGADHELVWLTGRPQRCRPDTRRWLRAAGLRGRLLMRAERDFRPARVLKVAALRALAAKRPIGILVDDDEEVTAAAEAAGFPVLLADWMPRPQTLAEAQERDGRT